MSSNIQNFHSDQILNMNSSSQELLVASNRNLSSILNILQITHKQGYTVEIRYMIFLSQQTYNDETLINAVVNSDYGPKRKTLLASAAYRDDVSRFQFLIEKCNGDPDLVYTNTDLSACGWCILKGNNTLLSYLFDNYYNLLFIDYATKSQPIPTPRKIIVQEIQRNTETIRINMTIGEDTANTPRNAYFNDDGIEISNYDDIPDENIYPLIQLNTPVFTKSIEPFVFPKYPMVANNSNRTPLFSSISRLSFYPTVTSNTNTNVSNTYNYRLVWYYNNQSYDITEEHIHTLRTLLYNRRGPNQSNPLFMVYSGFWNTVEAANWIPNIILSMILLNEDYSIDYLITNWNHLPSSKNHDHDYLLHQVTIYSNNIALYQYICNHDYNHLSMEQIQLLGQTISYYGRINLLPIYTNFINTRMVSNTPSPSSSSSENI